MKATEKLKERFKRDCKLQLKLFKEPYFTERIELYDPYFQTKSLWALFTHELEKCKSEEEYFMEYNRTKDDAINFIKSTEGYQRFCQEDFNKFAIKNKGFNAKDIYHQANIGREFISVDMKKANFNALKNYDSGIFNDAYTWEEFVGMFTENNFIRNSKYIREVILGNCNCKGHITYEKYLMDMVLSYVLQYINKELIVFFSNDEFIVDITDLTSERKNIIEDVLSAIINDANVPLRLERYKLQGVIDPSDMRIYGYIRRMNNGEVDFKCINNLIMPFVLRELNGEDPQLSDLVFEHEGMLAQFMTTPRVDFVYEYKND